VEKVKPLTKPSKQRRILYQAPSHVRHKLLGAHLSPELRGSYIVKNLPARTGDTVRVMRGDHKGFEGKVSRVDVQEYRIYVEGLTREKVDGSTIFVPVHPSKVIITRLNLDDKWRKDVLERKKTARRRPKEVEEKPRARLKEKPLEIVEEVPKEEAAEEKPPKKKVVRRKRKTAKKVVTRPKRVKKEAEESKKIEKPKTQKKRIRRKIVKKTEKGGK
jgi:large subunit ribosomal protein L24